MMLFCGSLGWAAEYTLRIHSDHPEYGIKTLHSQWFADEVEKRSGGRIEVKVYPSNILGDTGAVLDQIDVGQVDITSAMGAHIEPYCEKYGLWDTPYVFVSIEHAKAAMTGKPVEIMADILREESNFDVLCVWAEGPRDLLTRTKPVWSVEDVRGMKIRVMGVPMFVKAWNLWKAIPVPLAWTELYTAMQQGVIEGVKTSPCSMVQEKFPEVSKYYSQIAYLQHVMTFLVSKKTMAKLPEDLRKIVKEVGRESQAVAFDLLDKLNGAAVEEMREKYRLKCILPSLTGFIEESEPLRQERAKELEMEEFFEECAKLQE